MNKNQITDIVVNGILEEMEKGVAPWRQPWIVLARQNLVSRKAYRGINRLVLSLFAGREEFFLTFNQAKKLGGTLKTGAKGLPVVFWSKVEGKTPPQTTAQGNKPTDTEYFVMKYYTVFRLSDVNGITPPQIGTPKPVDCNIEAFIKQTGAVVTHHGGQASYNPATDVIALPEMARFDSQGHYYATLFHELVHWTGGAGRLDRFKKNERFGLEQYSREELVAEIGAAMLCRRFAIDLLPESASYITNWLKTLKEDKSLIISAASRAEKAMDFLGVFADEKAASAEGRAA